MTNEEKQLQLLQQIEYNTRYTANSMSFFKTMVWIGIIVGVVAFFIIFMSIITK